MIELSAWCFHQSRHFLVEGVVVLSFIVQLKLLQRLIDLEFQAFLPRNFFSWLNLLCEVLIDEIKFVLVAVMDIIRRSWMDVLVCLGFIVSVALVDLSHPPVQLV